MPIADSQQRDDLDQTLYQARNTTIASMVCSQIARASSATAIAAAAKYDRYIVNTSGGSVTMTLPPLADVPVGRKLSFYKPSASNTLTVDGYGSETIEGSANVAVTAQYAEVAVEKIQTGANTFAWMLRKGDVAAGSVTETELADDAVTNAKLADDAVDSAQIADGAVDLVHMSANSVDSAQYVDGSIDPEHLAAAAVDSPAIATGAVDPVHLSSTEITPAADAACAILNTTTEINLTVTAAGTVGITTTSSVAGQEILIRAVAVAGGGSYTLVAVGGTLTLNSTGETALVRRNAANNAWLVASLTSQVSGGAPATVV